MNSLPCLAKLVRVLRQRTLDVRGNVPEFPSRKPVILPKLHRQSRVNRWHRARVLCRALSVRRNFGSLRLQGLDRQVSTCAIEVYAEMANHLPDMAQFDLVKFWK